jgi:hypothetical protein
LIYIALGVVDSNKLKKKTHAKYWLVQLAIGTKRKVFDSFFDYEFSLGDQNTKINLIILSLGSYNIIIEMDCLERQKATLDCYEKSLKYKDENDIVRTIQGIQKLV